MKKWIAIVTVLFLLFAGAVGWLQSSWGKERVRKSLVQALEKSGFKAEIQSLGGSLPYQIELRGITIQGNGLDLSIESLDLQLSLIRLLKRELAFNSAVGYGVSWKKTGDFSSEKIGSSKGVSIPIYVRYFNLKHVEIPDLFTCDLEGRFKIGKNKTYFEAFGKRPDYKDASGHIALLLKKNGNFQVEADIDTPTLRALTIQKPYDAALSLHLSARMQKGVVEGKLSGNVLPKEAGILDRDWTVFARFRKPKEGPITLTHLLAKSDLLNAKGRALLSQDGKLETATLQIHSDKIIPGRVLAHLNLAMEGEAIKARSSVQIPTLNVHSTSIEKVRGLSEAVYENGALKGSGSISGMILEEKWEGKSNFSWAQGGSLFLSDLKIQAPYVEGQGNLEIRTDQIAVGQFDLSAENLQAIRFILPHEELYGKLSFKSGWDAAGGRQGLHLDINASDFYAGTFYSQKAALYSDLIDPFHTLQGNATLDLTRVKWGDLNLETASVETSSQEGDWPFALSAEGKWKHPLEINMAGFWRYKEGEVSGEVVNWTGSFFHHSFALSKSTPFAVSKERLRVENLELSLAGASFFANVDREKENIDAQVRFRHLPLDFLVLNPLDLSVGGRISLDAEIQERGEKLKGTLKATIEQMDAWTSDASDLLSANGEFAGAFSRDLLEVKGRLNVQSAPLLEVDASLPIHLELWPFKAAILPEKQVKGHLFLDGRIEDFLDFFNLGMHRLEGDCVLDLKMGHTLRRPLVEGYARLKGGFYQNYSTGTELNNIQADFLAEKSVVYLRSLTATTGEEEEKGNLNATGEIRLREEDHFPFRFDASFSNLKCVQMDLVTAYADGKIKIEGDSQSAKASGNALVTRSDLSIPDHIPRPLPNLQVVYKNPTQPVLLPETPIYKPYPLYLDLHVSAPDNIFITGRGLNSEWKGDFQVGGTYSAIATKGKLELLQGGFSFSGKDFKLVDGSLSFTGKEHEMPHINIAALTSQKGVAITARLKGPLNSPQLTFQSVPPLPLSAIMSYLLFGQDLSEINGFQALQLATSLASLAGQGPDVMQSTRRSLGVDRLRVVTSPDDGDGSGIALQVGKYVADGVIVSYSQGTEDSSSNVSIEVEIKDGLVFQAETDQQQEQGKFTLKWNLNY